MTKHEEYYNLGKQMDMLKKRRETLRKEILNDIEAYQADGWKVEIQLRKRQKVDDTVLEQLLYDKGLWDQCKKEVVDHSLVEQAYLEGKLTDSDLRAIDGGRSYTEALIVDKVGEEEDVQGDDESVC